MTRFSPSMLTSLRTYAGKLQTIRNQVRTERLMASLPEELRKDIGWPDRFMGGARD
ncbi:MAG: hypothetical protein JNL61_12335 [Rhizobiaceae bacterium]|nr:hypothetical protein [Rhizobiaceae bacterium]